MLVLNYQPCVDLFGQACEGLTKFRIKLDLDGLQKEYYRLLNSKSLTNDWELWDSDDVKQVKNEFDSIHPMFYGMKAYELAIRFKRTIGAIARQKQHIYSDDPTLHRNKHARQVNLQTLGRIV